jgi:mono/diheme cytochrome c family protein
MKATQSALLGLALVPLLAFGQQRPDLGKREYDSNCAVCHGVNGTGNGEYAGLLSTRLPDLTTLAQRNGGVFPFLRVYAQVDGSEVLSAHGSREMPIWGRDYRAEGARAYGDFPYNPESYVRARVLALTDYIYRLQRK